MIAEASGVCVWCGGSVKKFKNGKHAKYCSKECGLLWQGQYRTRNGQGIRPIEFATCVVCGKSFVKRHSRSLCCCKQCSKQLHNKPHKCAKKCVCKQCGIEFNPKKTDRTTFCGRACAGEWRKSQNKHGRIKYPHTAITWCCECGKPFKRWGSTKTCVNCRREHELKKGRADYYATRVYDSGYVICKECGKIVYRKKRASVTKYCSHRCSVRALKRETGNHRKRARRNGVEYDSSVKLKGLMIRDHERCQMCGHKVRRTKKHYKYRATLGHIVALSKGGSHTWDNVQLECWMCNTKHGDTTHGNRRLFV